MGKKTGLYFGSFNPVHIGHMAVANYAVACGPVDEVWFVVTPKNPFKQKNSLLPDHQRLEMVHRAIGDDLRFRASSIEFTLPQPHYTANTLRALKKKHPNRSFYLMMGGDNLESFHKWFEYEWILAHFDILVHPRPGAALPELATHENIHILNAPQFEISASFIREGFAEKRDLRHFLPKAVWEYIHEEQILGF
jgi:nicotinate-nucleotide adenylyltransferase